MECAICTTTTYYYYYYYYYYYKCHGLECCHHTVAAGPKIVYFLTQSVQLTVKCAVDFAGVCYVK